MRFFGGSEPVAPAFIVIVPIAARMMGTLFKVMANVRGEKESRPSWLDLRGGTLALDPVSRLRASSPRKSRDVRPNDAGI